MRALVVDDCRSMRLVLRQILGELGFDVVEAEEGLQALERLREVDAPELALVDWNMPGMNGLELVRALRADARYAGTRILIVTQETGHDALGTALGAGADECVMKPFTRDVILEKLALLGLQGRA